MNNELEPCPFCGGDVKLDRNFIICDTCAVRMERATVYPRWHEADELAQRWNTRHKPMCKPIVEDECPVCSECGEDIDTSWVACPYCGAEVVND